MRVVVTGSDGYIGWPLMLHLASQGHRVSGIDNGLRRRLVNQAGSQSMIPITSSFSRICDVDEAYDIHSYHIDLTNYEQVAEVYDTEQPDAIVYLGEMPSAPWSMIDCEHAVATQTNNVMGTLVTLHAMRDCCPSAHLIKLGTMGEYGTPNVPIPEGFFTCDYRGKKDWLMFPRDPGSFYHLSKVHDTYNVRFACKVWGLRSTDIMQGVVYGTQTDETVRGPRWATRFDVDQHFGTAINRFVAQAVIEQPITPYGRGGQTRGFIPLRDSIQCLRIAMENPPQPGEYRTLNQFEETYSIEQLAQRVLAIAEEYELNTQILPLENPRREAEDHFYEPDHGTLFDLGYKPTTDMNGELRKMFADLIPHRKRIEACSEAQFPDVRWDGTLRKSKYLDNLIAS